MLKKKYQKPSAEYIVFYSDEEITADLPLDLYANSEDSVGGNAGISGNMGSSELRPGVPDD